MVTVPGVQIGSSGGTTAVIDAIEMAMLFDITGDKPGNVGPSHHSFISFIASCRAIIHHLRTKISLEWNEDTSTGRISSLYGSIVRDCTRAMMDTAGTNTLFGEIVLLAPVLVSSMVSLPVVRVLDDLDWTASLALHEAFLDARPRVLSIDGPDIQHPDIASSIRADRLSLKEWMRSGAGRNLVADMYLDDYRFLNTTGPVILREICLNHGTSVDGLKDILRTMVLLDSPSQEFGTSPAAIIARDLYVWLLGTFVDPLVESRIGLKPAIELRDIACGGVAGENRQETVETLRAIREFVERWGVNPGAVADIVFAVALMTFISQNEENHST